jgi:mycothiol synthase
MHMCSDDATQIATAALAERMTALDLVFSHLESDQRRQQVRELLDVPSAGELTLDGLFVARCKGSLAGAVLGQVQPGRTANIWLPRVDPAVTGKNTCPPEKNTALPEKNACPPAEIAERLLQTLCDWLSRQDVCLAHVLLDTCSEGERDLLLRNGFRDLGCLLYLVSLADDFPKSAPSGALEFEPYSSHNHKRFARLVEATYRQTQDCPELNGVRNTEDVLAGYRAAGVFDPKRWLIARHQGRDVGCLLLADHPKHENMELVYMGVSAESRGRQWGLQMTRHAQWLARLEGRPRLVLGVDAANEPAIRVYAAAGFQAWDHRIVFVKIFSRAETGLRPLRSA